MTCSWSHGVCLCETLSKKHHKQLVSHQCGLFDGWQMFPTNATMVFLQSEFSGDDLNFAFEKMLSHKCRKQMVSL